MAYVIETNKREVIDLAVAFVVLCGDGAKASRGEDFDEDDAVAEDHDRKWN